MNDVDLEIGRKTRRSFLTGAIAAAVGFGGWEWLRSRRADGVIPWPLRASHELNEQFARDYFRGDRLAATFSQDQAEMPKVNGEIGLDDEAEIADWKLTIDGLADSADPVSVTFDDIRRLPKIEMVTELKCIEGWSKVVHWTGARFSDFAARFAPGAGSPDKYVSLETPDKEYYVGLDMASAMHPQTLLCYEMDGDPLTAPHGAPVRLVVPLKYGIKNLKRIGRIAFTQDRPPDYWAERGYDWYAGF